MAFTVPCICRYHKPKMTTSIRPISLSPPAQPQQEGSFAFDSSPALVSGHAVANIPSQDDKPTPRDCDCDEVVVEKDEKGEKSLGGQAKGTDVRGGVVGEANQTLDQQGAADEVNKRWRKLEEEASETKANVAAEMRQAFRAIKASMLDAKGAVRANPGPGCPVRVVDMAKVAMGLEPPPESFPQGFHVLAGRLSAREQLDLAKLCVNKLLVEADYNNLSANGRLETDPRKLREEVRWLTVGYNYDWTNRKYREGWITKAMPSEFSNLCRDVAREVGCGADFKSEAAIVNMYASDTKMGPHRDDAELTMRAPIVSISLGCAGVFCIETSPPPLDVRNPSPQYSSGTAAVIVRSGDVVVMGGASRNALHGLSCMLPGSFTGAEWAAELGELSQEDKDLVSFLRKRRLNINVRQVEGDGPGETFAAWRGRGADVASAAASPDS